MLQVAHHHSVKAHATSYPPFTSLVCESDGDGSETSSFREAPDAVPWAIVRMQGSHRGGGDVRREGGGGGEREGGRERERVAIGRTETGGRKQVVKASLRG